MMIKEIFQKKYETEQNSKNTECSLAHVIPDNSTTLMSRDDMLRIGARLHQAAAVIESQAKLRS